MEGNLLEAPTGRKEIRVGTKGRGHRSRFCQMASTSKLFKSERVENRKRVENDKYLKAHREKQRKLFVKERTDEQGLDWNQPLDLLPSYNTVVMVELSTQLGNTSWV